jgi:hypothetical protein
MMTWHVSSIPDNGFVQIGKSISQSGSRLGHSALLSVRRGPGDNGSGRDPARATHVVLLVFFYVMLFVLCIMPAAALLLQQPRTSSMRLPVTLETNEGVSDCSLPTSSDIVHG